MKLCSVFGYMGYQVSIRNDMDWSPEMRLSDLQLDITYIEPEVPPADDVFAEAANNLLADIQARQIEGQKRMEYPDYETRLKALELQVIKLCQKSLISFEPDFMKTLSDIEKIDTKYLTT